MHPPAQLGVAGDVHVDHRVRRRALELVVGDHLVVHPEAADEVRPAGGREPDHLDTLAAREHERGSERRLARRAGEPDARGAEEALLVEHVVDQERRAEERPEEHLAVLAGARLGRRRRVRVVDGRQVHAVRRGVHEAAAVGGLRAHHQVGRGGEVPVHAGALRQVVVRARLHVGEAPDRDPPPALLGGEELPVRHGVAHHGVGHVVRGEAEALEREHRLAGAGLRHVRLVEAALAEVVAADQEVHGRSLTAR